MNLMNTISAYIDNGDFNKAKLLCFDLLESLKHNPEKSETLDLILFNLAGFFVDLGHMAGKPNLSHIGFDIMTDNQKKFLKIVAPSNFYYNLANAKTNLISEENSFDLTFENIEELVEAKNYYWKALRESQNEGEQKLELFVNLANILKRQFRLSESLRYYDIVNSHNFDIPQSHTNRSDTLKMLNVVSNSYSVKMIQEISQGYKTASKSTAIPPSWTDYYKQEAVDNEAKIAEFILDKNDEESTRVEYENLSSYRKFCIENHLTLSEHGLYCSCSGSARDNLTIPLTQQSIQGTFVPRMEMVLNRVKSEYSLARRNYYEYLHPAKEYESLLHEDCFTELCNKEMLGIPVEKIRSSFRLCFGILDKIALAVCDLYKIPQKGPIYFHNFWRLNKDGRREIFEAVKNPGLLALYSIATDLNMHKNGEWACFKDWRNALEHSFFVILEEESKIDPYKSLSATKEGEIVYIEDFKIFLLQLLLLTRSAIFSFVFSVRNFALEQPTINAGINCKFERKNFNGSTY